MSNGGNAPTDVLLLRGAEGTEGHSTTVAVGDDEISMSAHRSFLHPPSNECSTWSKDSEGGGLFSRRNRRLGRRFSSANRFAPAPFPGAGREKRFPSSSLHEPLELSETRLTIKVPSRSARLSASWEKVQEDAAAWPAGALCEDTLATLCGNCLNMDLCCLILTALPRGDQERTMPASPPTSFSPAAPAERLGESSLLATIPQIRLKL